MSDVEEVGKRFTTLYNFFLSMMMTGLSARALLISLLLLGQHCGGQAGIQAIEQAGGHGGGGGGAAGQQYDGHVGVQIV